jgi:hypothetical protein
MLVYGIFSLLFMKNAGLWYFFTFIYEKYQFMAFFCIYLKIEKCHSGVFSLLFMKYASLWHFSYLFMKKNGKTNSCGVW